MHNKEIREVRGIRNLVISLITKDDATEFKTETPRYLAGAAKLSRSSAYNQNTKYYDNKALLITGAEGEDTFTIDSSALDLETLALITGRIYDKVNDCILEGTPEIRYFAMGYVTSDTAGHDRYVWRYKVQFGFPDEEYTTKNADAESNGQTLECKSIYPIHEFTYKMGEATKTDSIKAIVISDEGSYDGLDEFFDTVVTPDKIYPVAA